MSIQALLLKVLLSSLVLLVCFGWFFNIMYGAQGPHHNCHTESSSSYEKHAGTTAMGSELTSTHGETYSLCVGPTFFGPLPILFCWLSCFWIDMFLIHLIYNHMIRKKKRKTKGVLLQRLKGHWIANKNLSVLPSVLKILGNKATIEINRSQEKGTQPGCMQEDDQKRSQGSSLILRLVLYPLVHSSLDREVVLTRRTAGSKFLSELLTMWRTHLCCCCILFFRAETQYVLQELIISLCLQSILWL